MSYRLKRVYEAPASGDGQRVLVDRLWPRGVSKAEAQIDYWAKDASPSPELRQWFHDDPQTRWPEFQARYQTELAANDQALDKLRQLAAAGPVTLIYAARDAEHNHAQVLKDYLVGAPK